MKNSTIRSLYRLFGVFLVFFLSTTAYAQDFINIPSLELSGNEDTTIPLGLTLNSTLTEGGSQLDVIGTDIGFRDAGAGAATTSFTIPANTDFIRISGFGANENAGDDVHQDEFQHSKLLVHVDDQTYAGHLFLNTGANDSYSFSDVALGSASLSGTLVGDFDAAMNSVTVSIIGNTLLLSETQNIVDQAYLVEFLSNDTSSNYINSSGLVLDSGAGSGTVALPAGTNFSTITVGSATNISSNFRVEHKSAAVIHLDVDTQTASGVIYAERGRGAARAVAYAFTGYDTSSGVPILSSTATIVGDIVGSAANQPNPILSLSSDTLTITRSSSFASTYTSLISLDNYTRVPVESVASVLEPSAISVDTSGVSGSTDVFDLPIPNNAEVATITISLHINRADQADNNENAGFGTIQVDLLNGTTSGSISTMRVAQPDLIYWNQVPFGTRLIDHPDTISNHASAGDFIDQISAILNFTKVEVSGNDVLRATANHSKAGAPYTVVMHAEWFGRDVLPVIVTISGASSIGTLTAGKFNDGTGDWTVLAADVPSLRFEPRLHMSGDNNNVSVSYDTETHNINIAVLRLADAPTLTTVNQSGLQHSSIDISTAVTAQLVDLDGSETITTLELTVPDTHTISDGVNAFTASTGLDTVDIKSWNLAALTYQSPDTGVFTVDVRAITTDDDGFSSTTDTAQSVDSFEVDIDSDNDGDGYPDAVDLDDDNDGIPDVVESLPGSSGATPIDTDGDGIFDHVDLDSDNDGIPDALEAGGADSNGDGIIDGFADSNNDGMDDTAFNTPLPMHNTDGDAQPDYLDTDSDNDGLTDAVEAGGSDANGDGEIDGFTDNNNDGLDDATAATPLPINDSDGDSLPDYRETDSDNDGIPDSVEAGANLNEPVDTDSDGAPDYTELDSDDDSIPDAVEAGSSPSTPVDSDGDLVPDYLAQDSDSDGIPDSIEAGTNPNLPADTDGDGVMDFRELDSDDDGIPDAVEAGPIPIIPLDTDADGILDFLDTDSDSDGIPDSLEAGLNPLVPADTDADGTPDYREEDSDSDGIPDSVEAGTDPNAPVDTDGDGVMDFIELDSDKDGIPDNVEAGSDPSNPVDTNSDGVPDYMDLDSDSDGIPDTVEAGPNPSNPVDTDGDSIPDYLELDSDSDGIPDSLEAGTNPNLPVDTNGDGVMDFQELDSDDDGIPDNVEAGPNPTNPLDTDADGVPDFLETDSDGDGIPDSLEAGLNPLLPADTDADGTPDYREEDSDSDGIPDSVEAGTDPNLPVDTDGDGVMDFIDLDSDNDGIPDNVEAGSNPGNPVDTNSNGAPDYIDLDSDSDGIPDRVEAGPNSNAPVDTDSDGVMDFRDPDSDDDSIPDYVEAGSTPTNPVDTDGDGFVDYQELDSDNDGASDLIEAGSDPLNPTDTDGDGIPDYRQASTPEVAAPITEVVAPVVEPFDSDGDGISDAIEGTGDSDGDGIPDHLDIDSDNDGLLDSYEAGYNLAQPVDTDGDGIADYVDLDSDNDGLTDVLEAGGTDLDGDGIVDGFNDADGNGHDDATGLMPLADFDTDGDGHVDRLDLDSDNDGLPDVWETVGLAADSNGDGVLDDLTDLDGDGMADNVVANTLLDTDSDGAANHLDLDSDGDGLLDLLEAGGLDFNGDGLIDGWTDSDGDGIADSVDVDIKGGTDIDNDGIYDFADADFVVGLDSDGDGIVDAFDYDFLGTGYLPIELIADGSTYTLPDLDGSGIADVVEPLDSQAVLPVGVLRTGLSGTGCSISSQYKAGLWPDPALPLLTLFAAIGIGFRRCSV